MKPLRRFVHLLRGDALIGDLSVLKSKLISFQYADRGVGGPEICFYGKGGNAMMRQRARSLFSAILLFALLILPLACASISQKRRLNEVKSNVEATWILEEWHMKGEVVRPPKVDGRFIMHDNVCVVILLNRADKEPWSYYTYGNYTLDASTFAMQFDETSFFKESTSGITVSRKLTFDGKIKSFAISKENNKWQMQADDGTEVIVEGDTLIYGSKGKITRIWRRAGAE